MLSEINDALQFDRRTLMSFEKYLQANTNTHDLYITNYYS